jgi:VWFA-related protein
MTKRTAALLVLAFGVALTAQQAPGPTFKSNVEAITLDVRVVDQNGQFVDGLTKDDLKIFEDGREQTITAFERVNIPIHEDERPLFTGQPVDSDVASNAAILSDSGTPEGRLYVLLLDDLHTLRSTDVRAQARDFIEHHFTESDRAVVLSTSGRLKLTQEFTNNRERLLTAIDQFQGGFDKGTQCGMVGHADGSATDVGCGCNDDRFALHTLSAVASWLVPVNGQRKALLFFGEGLSGDSVSVVSPGGPESEPAPGGGSDPDATSKSAAVGAAVGACAAVPGDRKEAAGNAARANMTVYPLDPRRAADGMFKRIVADTSSYYLLGYLPTNAKHDGTFRKLDVRAVRPGLTVQARTGYTAKRDASPKPSSTGLPPALTELLSTPIQVSGLTMSISAPSFLGRAGQVSVEVIVDVAGADLMATSASAGGKGSLELVVAVADAEGHVKATEHGSLAMNLSAATRDAVAQHGLRVLSRLDVPPGRYLLRIVGVDGGGNSKGSVQYDLDVPDFSKGPLTMSGLALASVSDLGRPTTGSDKAWNQRFAQPPTAARVFSDADDILVSGEIYRNDSQLEDIDVTTSVRSASDEVVFERDQTLTPGTNVASGAPSTLRHQTKIPLQGMDAGDYLLVVEAASTADTNAVASRQIPFTIR